jgi:ATP-binding cassette subfamily B protein
MSNLFSVFPAKSVQRAIDELSKVLQNKTGQVDAIQLSSEVGKIVLYCTGLVLLFAFIRAVFLFFMRQSLIVMSRKIEYDLKNEIFKHYQSLDQAFYRRNNTGDLMARITEDVSRVRMYIGPAIMYFTNLVATFLVVIPAMISVSSKLALYVLLPLPVLSFCIFYVNNIINKRSDAIQSQLSRITSFTQETFNGIRVIKAFGAEQHSYQAFRHLVDQYRDRSMSLAKVDATFFPLMMFLTGLSTIITIFAGGIMVIRHEITIGNIAEYVFYVNLLVWPVTALGFTTSLIQRAAASQRRINEFLHIQPELVSVSNEPIGFPDEIQFSDVSYTYPEKQYPAADHLSFILKKGQTLGILGSTGSGKSTIAQLLLRMMDPNTGQILIDGIPLDNLSIPGFRSMVGYVPQDVFLFSDTIRNNILFGESSALAVDEKRLKQAINDAGLSETLNELPEGLETMIGERGIMLSGGQKQRVSIARALYRNAGLLVFDDCLSAVDTRTETYILEQLRSFASGKTTVMISHRVSTLRNADYLLVLEQGKIVEEGTHQSLLELKSRYFHFYQKQQSEESVSV